MSLCTFPNLCPCKKNLKYRERKHRKGYYAKSKDITKKEPTKTFKDYTERRTPGQTSILYKHDHISEKHQALLTGGKTRGKEDLCLLNDLLKNKFLKRTKHKAICLLS